MVLISLVSDWLILKSLKFKLLFRIGFMANNDTVVSLIWAKVSIRCARLARFFFSFFNFLFTYMCFLFTYCMYTYLYVVHMCYLYSGKTKLGRSILAGWRNITCQRCSETWRKPILILKYQPSRAKTFFSILSLLSFARYTKSSVFLICFFIFFFLLQ